MCLAISVQDVKLSFSHKLENSFIEIRETCGCLIGKRMMHCVYCHRLLTNKAE